MSANPVPAPKANYAIGDIVRIADYDVIGKVDEIVLFRRENIMGYRVVDRKDWSWYYVDESQMQPYVRKP